MKRFSYLSFAVLCFLVILPPARRAFSEETETERLVRLNAERIDWLETVSFYADYTYSRAVVSSEEEAASAVLGESGMIAEGFLCKSNDKCRLQIVYENASEDSDDPEADTRPVHSVDMLANNYYMIVYHPLLKHHNSTVGSLNKVTDKSLTGLTHSLMAINAPMSLFIDPIDKLPGGTPSDPGYEYTESEEGRALITLTGTNAHTGSNYVKEITFRTDLEGIAIERIVLKTYGGETGKLLAVAISQGFGWKNCGGRSVPSRVRSFTGPLRPAGSGADSWVVSEWESAGLGDLAPSQKDFILKLDPNVELSGLNQASNDGEIDIDKITSRDFAVRNTLKKFLPPPKDEESPDIFSVLLRGMLILFAALFLIGALIRVCKRKFSLTPPVKGE